jgi:hypothetical protein
MSLHVWLLCAVAASSLSVGAIKKVDARSGRKSMLPTPGSTSDPSQIKPGGCVHVRCASFPVIKALILFFAANIASI